jgi:hypothetical protein
MPIAAMEGAITIGTTISIKERQRRRLKALADLARNPPHILVVKGCAISRTWLNRIR